MEAENTPCGGAISERGCTSCRTTGSSCTKAVTIRLAGQVVRLRQGMEVRGGAPYCCRSCTAVRR